MAKGRGAGIVEDIDTLENWYLEGDFPGYENSDKWRPIRVAFTRWRVPAPVAFDAWNIFPNWNDFGGYKYNKESWGNEIHDETRSFLQSCKHSHGFTLRSGVHVEYGRFLHKEEANLKPAGQPGHEYLEMYDKAVGRNWKDNPDVMDHLNYVNDLPLIHIIVNTSDKLNNSKGSFDLFFPHELQFGKIDSIRYENSPYFSPEHKSEREGSAKKVGACPNCAFEIDGNDYDYSGSKNIVHIVSKDRSEIATDDVFGYRGFGQDITTNMANPARKGGLMINLPTDSPAGRRIFLPRSIVNKVFNKGTKWTKMKIFPPLDWLP